VARFRGIPVRFHWTTPLCAILVSRFEFRPVLWVGYLVLVLMHELGHAAVVRYHGHQVESVDVHGLGGLCRWSGRSTPIQRATIAWGGVWAQMIILAAAYAVIFALGPPMTSVGHQLATLCTSVNFWVICINLVPIRPLDGAEAWPLFGLLWRRRLLKKQAPRVAHLIAVPRDVRIRETAIKREEEALTKLEDEEDPPVSPEVELLLDRVREIAAREGELARISRIERKDE
jgi:Zn-dependent protease